MKSYNRKAQDLSEIVPSANYLYAKPLLSYLHPIGSGIWTSLFGSLASAYFFPEVQGDVPVVAAAGILFGAGTLPGFIYNRYCASKMKDLKEEIKYVEKKIGI